MSTKLARLTGAIVALLFLAGFATAQEVTFPEAADPVAGVAGVTYLDLVREIVSDASLDAEGIANGTATKALRHISGDDSIVPPATARIETGISALQLDDRRVVLLFETGRPDGDTAKYAVLALYDLTAKQKLLDAVNVGYDESTFFLNPVRTPLGGGDLFLTLSLHFNSSQAYQTTGLTLLRANRFEYIDAIFTFDDKHCAFERTQQVAFDTSPSETDFLTIDASVTETTTRLDAECGEDTSAFEPGERTIANAYVWDAAAARYVAETDAFKNLARENEGRF